MDQSSGMAVANVASAEFIDRAQSGVPADKTAVKLSKGI
jgi:hypothetical protein